MLKFLKSMTPSDNRHRRKEDQLLRESEFKEVAFNSRTKKTLVRDGDDFLVVVGTNKSFVDTLRTLKYIKFPDMETAIAFFKQNGEKIEEDKDPTTTDSE